VTISFFWKKKQFRFKKWWLQKESFTKVVEKDWSQPCHCKNSIDVWQFRIRTLRRLARGWAANEIASMNKEKSELALEYNNLEKEMESRVLTDLELSRLREVSRKLDNIWALEEIKVRQRSRDINILECDKAVANQRSRKKNE
jgi:hypothetical protein